VSTTQEAFQKKSNRFFTWNGKLCKRTRDSIVASAAVWRRWEVNIQSRKAKERNWNQKRIQLNRKSTPKINKWSFSFSQVVRLDIGRSCFCSTCWYKPTYLTQLCKTKSNTKKPWWKKSFLIRDILQFLCFGWCFRKELGYQEHCSLVVLAIKTCNLPRILRNIRLSVRFHCESQACHAFYAAFSVLKLRVNLLFKTKRKTWSKHWQDCQGWSDSTRC